MDLSLALAYGITDFLDASIFIPYYQDTDDKSETFSSMGDMRLTFKLNYPPYEHNRAFELAYLLAFDLPTASAQNDGGYARNPWVATQRNQSEQQPGIYQRSSGWAPYGSNSPVTIGKLLMTANFKAVEGMVPLLLHLNFGMAMSESESENAFLLGGGADFWFSEFVGITWAADGKMDVSQATKHIQVMSYPMSHKVGLVVAIPQVYLTANIGAMLATNWKTDQDQDYAECTGVSVNAVCGEFTGDVQDGGDVDYVQDHGAMPASYKYARLPKFGLYGGLGVGLNFAPKDGDGDGLTDDKDYCPVEPEDADGFEDEDGCADLDNDQDGVADAADKCPDQAEDMDSFQDDDGCPDKDNDRDGIEDATDKCPSDIEDKDGFEDEDGCADLDNDQDGVVDNFDRCPIQSEDADGFEDEDGCPDLDNDKDGLPDDVDKCPDKPETINGIKDSDGCPD
jgi:hypothetical protein